MAQYTLRDIVSRASMEIGISLKPLAAVIGSPDQDIAQMQSLLHVVADEVLLDEPYKRTLGNEEWIMDAATGQTKPDFTADSDVVLFDGRLAIDGLKYRFKQEKGLEFGENMRDFINRQNKIASRVNGRVIDMDLDEGRTV